MCLGRESPAPSSVYTESRAGDGRCTERTVFRVAPCYGEARQAANLQGNTLARCAISAMNDLERANLKARTGMSHVRSVSCCTIRKTASRQQKKRRPARRFARASFERLRCGLIDRERLR